MFGVVYLTTNLINGKIYIGSDTKNSGSGDPNYFGSGVLLTLALKKYGVENFTKDILCTCDSLQDLKESETFYIRKYSSHKRDIGYNISDGYWGGNTLSEHPDLDLIRGKIKIKSKKSANKASAKRKEFYSKESEEERKQRILKIKKSMAISDKSFFSNPEYIKNLSVSIKNSEKFQNYTERRTGKKRGKYSIDKESIKNRRIQIIGKIKNERLKSLLIDIIEKDSSTFSCHSQVYLHIEGYKKIPGLDEFLSFLDKVIYSDKLTLKEAKEEYKRLGLDNSKLGKSSTVIKSMYDFKEFGSYPSRIIEVFKKI